MSRHTKPLKPYIVVFCEGESEQVYVDFLKKEFARVAVIKRPKEKGLFEEADRKFRKSNSFRDNAEVTDEIWFLFDVEQKDATAWEKRLKIIKHLRLLKGRERIRVRLLMTTGCIEYWFLLHYEFLTPPIHTVADKQSVMKKLLSKKPNYQKGDAVTTEEIAKNYETAVKNAEVILETLLKDGMPCVEDTDDRNCWLCRKCVTFSTVFEGIEYLKNLEKRSS